MSKWRNLFLLKGERKGSKVIELEYIEGMVKLVRGPIKKEDGNKTRLQARVIISLWRASPTGCFLVNLQWVGLPFRIEIGSPFLVLYDAILSDDAVH